MAELEVEYRDECVKLVRVKNLGVAVWSNPPTLAALDQLEKFTQAQRQRFPKGQAFVNLVVSGKPNFSSEVRARANAIAAIEHESDLVAAHVVLIPGIAGIAVRTFLTTLVLVARRTRPTKVFGDLGDSAAWMAPLLASSAHAWTAAEISGTLAAMAKAQS